MKAKTFTMGLQAMMFIWALFFMSGSGALQAQCPPGAVCATYTAGDISTDYQSPWVGPSICPEALTVVIPAGHWIAGIDVTYNMTAANGAFMSEQRSRLFSPTINAGEPAYINGVGFSDGTYSYSRTGLTFANGATGTLVLQMDAGRTWGNTAPDDGCGTAYNKVDVGTWSVVVHHVLIPACTPPTALSASNITPTSLELDWTESGTASQWEIQGGPAGFPLGLGQTGLTTTKPALVPGLDPSTTYDFYVRAICGPGDTSSWTGPYTVTTAFACPPNAVCATYTAGDISSDRDFTSLGQTSACPATLTMVIPPGNWITGIDVEYDMTSISGGGAWISEQLSWLFSPSTNAGEASLTPGPSINSAGTASYSRTGLSFANEAMGNVDIQLHAGRTFGGSGCAIDHVIVDDGTWMVVAYYAPAPNCITPSSLGFTVTGANAVDLHWTESGAALQWEIEWGPAGFALGTGTSVITTTNPHSLAAVPSGTSLQFYVRGICAPSDTTAWAGPITFGLPLVGTYTIGGASPDFATFTDAVNALQALGVNGAVTFQVAPGTYNEQIILENYAGVSAVNDITFTGADPATTILTFEQNVSDDRYTVRFDGASFIAFEDMTIEADPMGTYGWAIHISPNTSHIVVKNCSIITDVSSTSTFYNGVIASGSNTGYTTAGANIEHLRFEGNTFIGGYNSIRLNGVSTSKLTGVEIIDNTMLQTQNTGIYLSQVEEAEVKGNHLEGRTGITSGGGVWLANVDNFAVIENYIYNQGQYGVYLTASSGTMATPSVVANNVIAEVGNTTTFASAIRVLGSSSYIDIVYNSCLLSANNGRVFQITVTTPSDLRLLNNSFVHMGGGTGYAMYISSTGVISEIDNNNYYTNGSNFVYYVANRADLAALQAVNAPVGNDLNSVSVDPGYSADLQTTAIDLFEAGTPVTGITNDILGNPRNPVSPCIGAYEYILKPNDAGITLLTGPATICAGSLDVKVMLMNYGVATLNSVDIYWSVNGAPQTPVNLTSLGLAPGTDLEVNLGPYTFANNTYYDLVFHTALPNGVADQQTENDTLIVQGMISGLDGTFTIGAGVADDYVNIADAIDALNIRGVCGPVVFNVNAADGPYIGGVEIGAILGTSAMNTVVFNGNGAVLNEGLENYVIALDGTSHLTINDFQIINSDPSNNKFGIMMRGGAQHIYITNNYIDMGMGTTSSLTSGIVASNSISSATTAGSNAQYVTITNNEIVGGYYGISLFGASNYLDNYGHVISNNIVRDFRFGGIRLNDADSVVVSGNDIHRANRPDLTTFYGLYSFRAKNTKFIDNHIHSAGDGSYGAYPIYHSASENNVGYETEYINNAIYNIGSTSTIYGIYLLGTRNNMNFYHNTLQIEGLAGSATRAVFASGAPDDHSFVNNIFSVEGAGTGTKYCIYISATSTSFMANNNVYYMGATAGTNHIGYWGSDETTLADWQTATSQDALSSIVNPVFADVLAGDLTPISATIDNMGVPVGVMTDIFGNPRSATTPDVGAIEFTGFTADIGLVSAHLVHGECLSSNDTVFVDVVNNIGAAIDFSVNPLTVVWSVTGPTSSAGTIVHNTGTLLPTEMLTLTDLGVDMSLPGVYTLSVYIGVNATNLFAGNDTLNDVHVLEILNPFFVVPSQVSVFDPLHMENLSVESKFFPGGDIFFTEICHWAGTSTGAPTGGKPSWLGDDYVELTGVPNSDLSGFMIEKWASTGTSPNVTHTFPPGTSFSPNGTFLLSTFQGTESLADFHQVADVTSSYASSTSAVNILKDPNGDIIDVVLFHTSSSIPANANVAPSDWTGPGTDGGSSWGIRLIGPDTDDNTNWVKATGSVIQDPGTPNAGAPIPVPGVLTDFNWTLSGVILDTVREITVGPWTTPGTYHYVASYLTPCGVLTDTVTIVVDLPTVSADTDICPGDSVLLEVNLPGTGPWTIELTDGTNFMTVPGISTSPYTMYVSPTVTTTYSLISYQIGVGPVYAYPLSTVVTVNPVPVVTLPTLGTLCTSDQPVTLDAGAGLAAYLWSDNSTAQTLVVDPATLGGNTSTTFGVTVTNVHGCQADASTTLNTYPTPLADAGTDVGYCFGGNAQLLATGSAGSGVFTSYAWSPATGLTNANISDPVASPNATTTYTVVITDDNGCQATDEVVVNVYPLPIVDAGSDQSTCAGLMVFLNATTTDGTAPFSYAWSPAATLNDAFIHNPEASPWVNTTYTVTVTDFYGCEATDDVFIESTALPVANAGADVTICMGESTQLQASGGTAFQWGPTYGLNDPTVFNPIASPPFTTTYTVTVSSICGVATDQVVVTVNPKPWVLFFGLPDSVCLNTAPIHLTGAPSGGVFSGPGMVGNVFYPQLAGAGGPYNITYTFTNAYNCSESVTMQVRVFADPYVSIANTPAALCVDAAPINLIGHPAGGTFSGPGIVGASFDPALAGPGTHVFNYTFMNVHGCHNTVYRTITVNPLPHVAILNLAGSYCLNSPTVQLQTNQTGGVFTGPGMGFGFFSPQAAGIGTHTVTYTFTNAHGCSNSSSYQVTVNPTPTVAFVGLQTEYCVDAAPVPLSATPAGGVFSGTGVFGGTLNPALIGGGNNTTVTYTYTDPATGCGNSVSASVAIRALPVVGISVPNANPCINGAPITLAGSPAGGTFSGPGITGNVFNPTAAGAGTKVITYTASNVYGCFNSTTANITVQPLPSVSMGGLSSSYCLPTTQNVNLAGFPAGGTFSGPGVSGTTFNPTAAGVGQKTIKYTFTSQYGCTDSVSMVTTVNQTVATITGLAASYCLNDAPVQLTGSTAGGATGSFVGNGMTGNTFNPTNAGVGGHTVMYTVTNPQTGCTGVATQNVTVLAIPNVGFSSLPTHFCINAPVFTVATSPATGGTLSGPGITGHQFDAATAGVGVHTLTYSFTNANGCTSTATQQVTVHALPTVSFTGLASDYCEEDPTVQLQGHPAGGTFSGPGIWGGGVFSPTAAQTGTHSITYTYTDMYGCANSETHTVEVYDNPTVDLGPDTTICINHVIVLDAGPGYASYEWSTGETTQSITVDASTYTAGWHYFTVTVTNANNCEASDQIRVIMLPCTGIEEVGDAQLVDVYPNPSNGQFNIRILNGESRYDMSVYNDLGQLIHREMIETGSQTMFTHEVNLQSQPTGLYMVRLTSDQRTQVLKVIVQ